MNSLLRLLAVASLAAILAAPAHAIIIYNNLSSDVTPPFNEGTGHTINPALSQGDQWFPDFSGFVTDLYLGMGRESSAGTGDLRLTLRANFNNLPAGAILETFVIDNADIPTQGSGEVLHVTALGTTFLAAGFAYWLVAEVDPGSGNAQFAWGENLTGDRGLHSTGTGEQTVLLGGELRGGLRVEASEEATLPGPGSTAVPEPMSLALLGLGLAGLGWSRRRPRG